MKNLRMLAVAFVAAMALAAFTAGSASATTLEVGGTAQGGSVTVGMSLVKGWSLSWRTTGGLFINTCVLSTMHGATASPFSATKVSGQLSSLTYGSCVENPIKVNAAGSLSIEWISGTTNGTVSSSGTEVITESPLGPLTCKTNTGTNIGTLTGFSLIHSDLDINAVLNCGIVPSALWQGLYSVTTPTGLGVVS